MITKQLKDIVKQMEALKTAESSAEFKAGVDAAMNVVNAVVQAAIDRERMQQLEAELAELRAKYAVSDETAPKKRGRKPKGANAAKALHEVE